MTQAELRLAGPINITWACEGYTVGSVANLMVISSKVVTLESFDASERLARELMPRYPRGVALLIATAPGTAMPSAAARKRMEGLQHLFQNKLKALALVLPGDSLWSNSMRMVANTLMRAMPTTYERRMFGEPGAAVNWLAFRLGSAAEFSATSLAELEARAAAKRTPRCAACQCQ